MAARKVRVALAQFGARLGDVSYNLRNCVSLVKQAAERQADIIVFPELCFTGYQLQILGDEVHRLSDAWYEEIDRTLKEASKAGNIHIVAGLCENADGVYYNAAYLYNRQGERAGCYRKAFSFGLEGNFFASGTEFSVFDTDFGRVGILLCYDIGFPETARKLSLAGAELLCIPAAWRAQDERAWDLNVASRAMENQIYAVGVNHAGQFGDLRLFGKSCVSGPDGRVLLQMGYDEQELGFCDIDLSVLEPLHRKPGYRYDLKRSKALSFQKFHI